MQKRVPQPPGKSMGKLTWQRFASSPHHFILLKMQRILKVDFRQSWGCGLVFFESYAVGMKIQIAQMPQAGKFLHTAHAKSPNSS